MEEPLAPASHYERTGWDVFAESTSFITTVSEGHWTNNKKHVDNLAVNSSRQPIGRQTHHFKAL